MNEKYDVMNRTVDCRLNPYFSLFLCLKFKHQASKMEAYQNEQSNFETDVDFAGDALKPCCKHKSGHELCEYGVVFKHIRLIGAF